VQGVVNPQRIFRKSGARVGDIALMSKPLGTGLSLAGGTDADKDAAIAGMRTLNRAASEQLQSFGAGVHAVTDVTGYGLAGHGWEMAERSAVALVIEASTLHAYPGAREAAQRGVRTGGDPRNRDYVEGHFVDAAHNDAAAALCFDPQTSGGLLAAVDASTAIALLQSGAWWRAGSFVDGAVQISLQ
jgi:selenide,water dikinase